MLAACCAVGLAAASVHWPGTRAEAYFLDDNQYLLHNPLVKNPGWDSVRRFFGEVWEPTTVEGYYQPLAMISLMSDYALSGGSVHPGIYRRSSLVFHALNSALLSWLIYVLLRRPWVAVMGGLLFAVHPVNVEAVIWIADRKTLLATFFALVSMIAYVGCVRRPRVHLHAVCMLAFLAALLAKPIVVPLPLLLVLLDYWPLGKLTGRSAVWCSVRNKAPLFVLSAAFAAVTFVAQTRSSSTQLPTEWALSRVPLVIAHNIVFYAREMLWLVERWPFHPFPSFIGLSAPGMLTGVVGTALIVAIVVVSIRWTKALMFAASFFVVAVFPTLGVVGFTVVIASDKYAYFPSVGAYIAVAALLAAVGQRITSLVYRAMLLVPVVGILAVFAVDVWSQQRFWQSDDALYTRVLKMAPTAAIPRANYGVLMHDRGRFAEAVALYDEALRIRPGYAEAHNNKGNALVALGRAPEAITQFEQALNIWPEYPDAHVSLGYALALSGRLGDAVAHYERALQFEPNNVQALNNLGNAFLRRGEVENAVAVFQRALAVDPTRADTYNNLAGAKVQAGDWSAGVELYRRALELDPRMLAAHYNLAETHRRLSHPEQARACYQQALSIARADGATDAARRIQERIDSLDTP